MRCFHNYAPAKLGSRVAFTWLYDGMNEGVRFSYGVVFIATGILAHKGSYWVFAVLHGLCETALFMPSGIEEGA